MNLRRKRLRLMRDTQWRGYARTAEGNPITLSQVRSVSALSVIGNSAQDGTPSPDNPVEVVGTGTRTGNLFDVNGLQFNGLVNIADGVITVSNMTGTDNLYCAASINFELVAGKQYTVIAKSARQGTGISAGSYDCMIKLQTNTTYDSLAIDFIGKANNYGIVVNNFIAPDNINDYKYLGTRINNDTVYTFENIMLIEGSNPAENLPPYEPYGYKVAVTASGRNLLDVNSFKDTASSSDTSILLKSNTQYTFKFESFNSVVYVYDVDEQGEETQLLRTEIGNYTRTFQTGVTGKIRIHLTKPSSTETLLSTWMLVQGSYTAETMPQYEPYKEPQSFNIYTPQILHGVGNAHDCVVIDFDNRKAELINNLKKVILDNDDKVWRYRSDQGHNRFDLSINDILYSTSINCISPWYKNEYKLLNNNIFVSAIELLLSIIDDRFTTMEDYMVWLEQQKANDNPIYAYYQTTSPDITDITTLQQWNNFPKLRGTWILTASGGTEPTLTAEYYSNERSTE